MSSWAHASSNEWARNSSPAAIAALISGAGRTAGAWGGEVDAVVGEHGVHLVGDRLDQVAEEIP